MAGVDFLVRKDQIGLRLSAKGFGFQTYAPQARIETNVLRPQYALEAMYQW